MKTIITTLIICLTFFYYNSNAQAVLRTCGHDHVMEKARADNQNFDTEYNAFLQQALNDDNTHRLNDTVYKVQVVFHILHKAGDEYQNVSDELIYSQLDALNRDFNMRNADTSETREVFKPFAGNARIEFELAKRRPNGNCADAIIRKSFNAPANFLPIFTDFLVKEDLFGGSTAWNTKKYLNIWVMDMNKGRDPEEGFLGGFAYFPDMSPVNYNGVVLDYRFFGQNNPYITDILPAFERYALGRACVHEVGHWFGLRHVWGDLGTLDPTVGCTADDGIGDTPNSATAYAQNGSCEDTIVNSCLDEPIDYPDMFENYMDYSTDECQSMYTLEQVEVMREALLTMRPQLIFEEVPNTAETITDNVMESDTIELCFELGDCFGFAGMISNFCNSDSTYTSDLGAATFVSESNCISYIAGSYMEDNNVDEFCIVVFDEHLQEYDTTFFEITITELCPNTDTVYLDIVEFGTASTCIEPDPCLTDEEYFITFCNNGNVFETNEIIGGITDLCINFAADEYNASNTQDIACVLSHYLNGDRDTTYVVLDISPATGLNSISSEENAFEVYPNPTSGAFSIKRNGSINESVSLSIFNTNGQQLRSLQINAGMRSANLNLESFSKGLYILMLESTDNVSFEKLTLE